MTERRLLRNPYASRRLSRHHTLFTTRQLFTARSYSMSQPTSQANVVGAQRQSIPSFEWWTQMEVFTIIR